MIPADPRWSSQMIPDDQPRWSQMIPGDPRWSQMIPNDPRWSETRWCQIIPVLDDHRWSQKMPEDRISNDFRLTWPQITQMLFGVLRLSHMGSLKHWNLETLDLWNQETKKPSESCSLRGWVTIALRFYEIVPSISKHYWAPLQTCQRYTPSIGVLQGNFGK